MGQQVHINLDGGVVDLALLRDRPKDPSQLVKLDDREVEVALLAGGMESGAHSIGVFARFDDGRVAMVQMSATMFLNVAAAIRGRLAHLGVLETKLNPPLAISSDRARRRVHFCTDAPLQSWDYTVDEAKKFWRVLRRISEEAGQ